MANSTFYASVNKILGLSGQLEVTSTSDFDIESNLSKAQYQTKLFTDLANRLLALEFNKRFAQREFSFSTTTVDNDYALDSTAPLVGIKWHSFYNRTSGGVRNRRLLFKSYEEWESEFPNPEQQSRSGPIWWIPKPYNGKPDRIILWPYPDAAYTINYQAKLDTVPLTTSNQNILFPTEYEHVLWIKGRIFLEESLNEGRSANMEILAREAVADVMRDSDGPVDDIQFIDLGMQLYGAPIFQQRLDFLETDDDP